MNRKQMSKEQQQRSSGGAPADRTAAAHAGDPAKASPEARRLHFDVTGMSCAACQVRVERVVGKVAGVKSVAVNLLKNSMEVVPADASPEAVDALSATICAAVSEVGYGASRSDGGRGKTAGAAKPSRADEARREAAEIRTRLVWSVASLALLMYVSMGVMAGLPAPEWLGSHEAGLLRGVLQLLLSLPALFLNRVFFTRGFKALWNRAPSMDSLIAVGASSAFVYGAWVLLEASLMAGRGQVHEAIELSHGLYFESAAMIVTLITVGKWLEARAKGRTTDALEQLAALAPKTAVVMRDGREVALAVEAVRPGDHVVLLTGSTIPVDGVVISGSGSVDESAMTGESIPVEKKAGDALTGATLVSTGHFIMRAERVGADTALAQIIRLVDEATSGKAPVARLADRVSGVFVPVVIGIALVTLLVWLLLGESLAFALTCAISVLVISCPCSLGLATPTAIMVGTGRGARRGILFKTAAALEMLGRTQAVVLDKTGTITTGKPVVTGLVPAAPGLETPLLMTAASLESVSEHPLGAAIVKAANARSLPRQPVEDFTQTAGQGICARIGKRRWFAGNARMAEALGAAIPSELAAAADAAARSGETPLFIGSAGEGGAAGSLLGMIRVADEIKPDSPAAVKALAELGVSVTMLTGDNEATARAIASRCGITQLVAGVLPAGKAAEVSRIRAEGRRVAMVGDGVNDAPALAAADTGVAIGAGTDVAIASADVVLMKSRLTDVAAAIELSRATLRNIRQNLFWAFFYNAVGIPVAAGLFASSGLTLSPMIAAAAMSLSSFCVVTNALRLRLFRPRVTESVMASTPAAAAPQLQRTQDAANASKEKQMTEKTIHIDGMHCNHCTGSVEKALKALPGVDAVEVSLEKKSARVEADLFVTDDMLRQTVEGLGFKVTGID